MDRKSLLFFLLLTSSFLFVNHYFSSQTIEGEKESIQKKTLVENSLKEEAAKRPVPYQEFGITPLYSEEGDLLTYAYAIGSHYLTLSRENLPSTLSLGKDKIHRAHPTEFIGSPLLYSSKKGEKLTTSPVFAQDGSRFYLVPLKQQGKTFLGEMHEEKMILSEALHENALAFTKETKAFAGIFDHKAGKIRALSDYLELQEHVKIETAAFRESGEKFYVLENPYQMLVFSTKGGSLAEINLPFQSKENPLSVVKEINFDTQMKKQSPENDYYPAHPYQIKKEGQTLSYNEGMLGGYYPLLRRSLITEKEEINISSTHYALAIVGEGVENLNFSLSRFEENLIAFQASEPHRRITKIYSFPENREKSPYLFDLTIQIEGDARNLWLNSGVPEVELISGSFTPALKYLMTRGGKPQVEKISLPDDKPGKNSVLISSVSADWICNSNGFLGMILDPITPLPEGVEALAISGKEVPTRLSLIDQKYDLYPVHKYPGYETLLPLKSGEMHFRIFAGPFQDTVLKTLDHTYQNPETGYDPNYTGAQSFHGWFSFISEPFAKFLFLLMKLFYAITHSWGISIILLTLALRIMLYPLNAWSIKSTARMQEIAPEMKKIQEKYKKDPKRAQMEIMKLYKEKGANPFMGCFPLLIQMPFLIGMFDLLKSTFELRGAVFIPGWINNLTEPDVLFSWNYPIIFFGTSFHLLPVLLGLVMYLQQKFTAYLAGTPKNAPLTEQQKQQKMMGNMMVILFTVLFYHFPSGLNIYWLSSMSLGILQQWIMKKSKK